MQIAGALLFGFLLSKFHPVICLKVASGLMMGLLPVTVISLSFFLINNIHSLQAEFIFTLHS